MDAIILAAGRGQRLRPLTDQIPKPLLEIANLSLIETHLIALSRAGFSHIIINLHHLGDAIQAKLGKGERYGLKISYSQEPGQALETAGGIINALSLIESERFAVISADILCDFALEPLHRAHQSNALGHLVLVPNPPHHLAGDFSLSDQNKLIDLDVRQETTKHTYSGIAWFDKALFSPLPPGKLALRPVLERAIENQQLSGEIHNGLWSDIGTLERLQAARQSSTVRAYIESIKQSIS